MRYRAALTSLLAAGLLGSVNAQQGQGRGQNNGQQNAASSSAGSSDAAAAAQTASNGNTNLCLDQSVISTGSEADGQGATGSDAGQAASITSNNNFIDFCKGKTITNGQQNKAGSCNPIPQGEIPAVGNMVSTVITSPRAGEDFEKNQTFTVTLQTQNLQAGSFTNPQVTYYSAPQQLNGQGQIIGHAHVSIQDMGGTMNPTQPLDPQQFVFFKGINDAGNGNGQLSATVTGGLLPGFYRVCTIMSSSNHLGVISPIAQRGVQDDCQKFTVGQGTGNTASTASTASAGGNVGNGQNAQASQQQGNGQQGGQNTQASQQQGNGQQGGQDTQTSQQQGSNQQNGQGTQQQQSGQDTQQQQNGQAAQQQPNGNAGSGAAASSVATSLNTATDTTTTPTTPPSTTAQNAAQTTGAQTQGGNGGQDNSQGGQQAQQGQQGQQQGGFDGQQGTPQLGGRGGRYRGRGRFGKRVPFMERGWVA